jgi:hypothetical protein
MLNPARILLIGAALAATLACVHLAHADSNLDGVSGVLTTPTAEVVADGHVAFNYGRYLSDTVRNNAVYLARAYSATIGYLPNLELTARFADYPLVPDNQGTTNFQDRSVSAKYQLFCDEDWSFAVGALDFGGDSQIGEGYYGVASWQPTSELQLSAGAGSGPLDGVFGSASYSPAPYVSLLAEYDGDVNYGAALHPAKGWTVKGGMANDHFALGLSYELPLNSRGRDWDCRGVSLQRCSAEYPDTCAADLAVRDALAAESFENVLVGSADGTLVVEFESRRFVEQNDALAVAAAIAATHCGPETERLVLSPKLDDIPQLTVEVGVDELLAFLADPEQGCAAFNVGAYNAACCAGQNFAPEANRKNWHGEVLGRALFGIELAAPGLPSARSRSGLGLEEDVYPGHGLRLRMRQDWPFFNDIEEKTQPVNRDAVLLYHNRLASQAYVMGAGGYFGSDRYGYTAEAAYYFPGDRFRMNGRYGYIRDQRQGQSDREDGVALGELSWTEPGLDWRLSAQGGNFLEGDQGLRVESRRYFGPTELSFFAYDTDASSPQGGFTLFVPLPWFEQQRHGAWRVSGSPYFGYQYRSDTDAWGDLPLAGVNIEALRQRLQPEYIAAHLGDWRRAVGLFYQRD